VNIAIEEEYFAITARSFAWKPRQLVRPVSMVTVWSGEVFIFKRFDLSLKQTDLIEKSWRCNVQACCEHELAGCSADGKTVQGIQEAGSVRARIDCLRQL